MCKIYFGDNLPILRALAGATVDLIYIDPPFNTGKQQARTQIKTIRSNAGDRIGFQGNRYETIKIGSKSYSDVFDDYHAFLEPRLREAHRVLAPNGTLYFHIDYREVHYCKIMLDMIFGRECFLNELIWVYDYGARTTKKWPPKHDNILVYVRDPERYTFNVDAIDRIPYMAPGLVGPEKARRGKLPTDTWWHTIVPTNSKERTGYPTQKPLGVLKRIVAASSNPGDLVLDFFAGSGTTGEACLEMGRRFILVDNNLEAMEVMAHRFSGKCQIEWGNYRPASFEIPLAQGMPFEFSTNSSQEQAGRMGMSTASKAVSDPDVLRLARVAASLEAEYDRQVEDDPWEGSPFAWIKTRPSRQIGKIGQQLLSRFCEDRGLDVSSSGDREANRVICGHRVEIKCSTLWDTGTYSFQQIRDQNYEYLICLGISPYEAHCWVLSKDLLLGHVIGYLPQHRGKEGTGTFWLTFSPDEPPDWMAGTGGTLAQAFEILRCTK
jgi:site-specific DNA-methyltransferase (adenine-specific)